MSFFEERKNVHFQWFFVLMKIKMFTFLCLNSIHNFVILMCLKDFNVLLRRKEAVCNTIFI